jgi:hypothetical protein
MEPEYSSPVSEMLTERTAQPEIPKTNLAKAQNRMKMKADKNHTEKGFQIGEKVISKLQPYIQQFVVSRPYPKLAFKFFGLYTIIERIGKVAYKLQLPDSIMVHPVFHVS